MPTLITRSTVLAALRDHRARLTKSIIDFKIDAGLTAPAFAQTTVPQPAQRCQGEARKLRQASPSSLGIVLSDW